jgi:hypothetical protein
MLIAYILLFLFLVYLCKLQKGDGACGCAPKEQFGASDWNTVHWGVQSWNGWPY